MASFEPLVREYRGDILDLTHSGYICVADDKSKVIAHIGNPEEYVCYRSAAKPIQALPVIALGLHKKYGLSEEETAMFSASHIGEPFHISALESIMKKAGLSEDMYVMKPTVPIAPYANEERIKKELPPRKIYHNCFGKHTALLLLQRELGGKPEDYYKPMSLAQREVIRAIACVSEVSEDGVRTALDGCGVPVYAVPLKNIAAAFKNLAGLSIKDEKLCAAAAEYLGAINKYPHMVRGTGQLCSRLNENANIITKDGALALYGIGLRNESLGIAVKITDGTEHTFPLIIKEVFKSLGCLDSETEKMLESFGVETVYNDNGDIAGRREIAFKL